MNARQFLAPLAAAALLTTSIGFANAATPAPGSGSAGTAEGRVEGSTNSNSMGEPAKTAQTAGKHKPMKHKGQHGGTNADKAAMGSGSAGTVEGRVAGSTNSNSKGEPAKVQ